MRAGFAASASADLAAVERDRRVGFFRFCAFAIEPKKREKIRIATRGFIVSFSFRKKPKRRRDSVINKLLACTGGPPWPPLTRCPTGSWLERAAATEGPPV